MLSEKTIIKINKNCTWKELAGNIIILQASSRPPVTHELNSTSSFIWNYLKHQDKQFSDILYAFTQEFNVSQSEAKSDLEEFLKNLSQKNLVCIQN